MIRKINNKIGNTLLIAVIFVFICLFFTNKVYSADLSLSPNSSTISIGNIVSVKVYVNTGGKVINNTDATILFPTDMLEVVSITKSSSIFSLWVEEPSFSNSTGKITFNGGVPNPGFSGANGYIATITFKAKKQGSASVIFTDGAVRENDGLGTDILISKSGSVIQIGIPKPVEVPTPVTINDKSTVPAKPVISSETHPDQDSWYQSNTATFSWKIPSGVTKIQTLMNKDPNGTPSINYDNSVTQKTLNNLSEGVYYFHLRYFNAVGASPIAHFKIKIDGTSPKSFTPTIRTVDDNNLITLDASDDLSGIDYYELKIDNNKNIKVKVDELKDKEYLLPILNKGVHEIVAIVYDKAGNLNEKNTTVNFPEIKSPEITDYSKEITKGEKFEIEGKSYKNVDVRLWIEYKNNDPKSYMLKTDEDGIFTFTSEYTTSSGLLSFYAETIKDNNVTSSPSDKYFIIINKTPFVKTSLLTMEVLILVIPIILLIIILMYLSLHAYYRLRRLRKRLMVDIEETESEVHKIFRIMKEDAKNIIGIFSRKEIKSKLTDEDKDAIDLLSKDIKEGEEYFEKRLEKIEKKDLF